MSGIDIRRAVMADLDAMMEVFGKARLYMRSQGNLNQWVGGYPSRGIVAGDIDRGNGYVGTDRDGRVVMAFAFIQGEDPTYSVIEDGEWPDDRPYGTIHRLGSDGTCHGVLRACVEYCLGHTDTLRLDTHADNMTMRHAAAALGFVRCGIIRCDDGTPRIAYQLSVRHG